MWKEFIGNEDLIFLTVANYGYLDLLINFYKSFEVVQPKSILHVMTYDKKVYESKRLNIECLKMKLWLIDDYQKMTNRNLPSESVEFKKDQWNTVTRFKLLAIWKLLESNKCVFYCDPDIFMSKSPVKYLQNLDQKKLWIQQGSPYCSGVMYVTPQTEQELKTLFNPKMWLSSPFDDENYLKDAMMRRKAGEHTLSILDFEQFPNGAIWKQKTGLADSKKLLKSCILFHFNFLVGVEAKSGRM